ncbi:MAG TPA: hypothetical protein VHV27_11925 [Phenylobacterium sp.]|jgi:hypothetical protein|nr:hypothetical protein [Phenylobacterium sp.]
MIRHLLLAAGLAAALSASAFAQPQAHDPNPGPNSGSVTRSLQGDGGWRTDPHIRELYEASVAAFAKGPAQVDRAAFEARSHEIFARFAVAHGVKPEAMQDHLKLIPGQIIQIATEDPEMLKSYDKFVVAIFGPE